MNQTKYLSSDIVSDVKTPNFYKSFFDFPGKFPTFIKTRDIIYLNENCLERVDLTMCRTFCTEGATNIGNQENSDK